MGVLGGEKVRSQLKKWAVGPVVVVCLGIGGQARAQSLCPDGTVRSEVMQVITLDNMLKPKHGFYGCSEADGYCFGFHATTQVDSSGVCIDSQGIGFVGTAGYISAHDVDGTFFNCQKIGDMDSCSKDAFNWVLYGTTDGVMGVSTRGASFAFSYRYHQDTDTYDIEGELQMDDFLEPDGSQWIAHGILHETDDHLLRLVSEDNSAWLTAAP